MGNIKWHIYRFFPALYLVENFATPALGALCAEALLVDPNQDRQSPYAILDFKRDHGDAAVGQTQEWLEANYRVVTPGVPG